MKKIRVIITLVLLAVSCVAVNAASNSATAKKILDKAAAKMSLKSGMQMNFTITGNKLNQSGTITVKGKKFNARTANAIMWYDGKTQWTYLKKNEEVNVTTPSAAKQAQMNPYSFINLYKKCYQTVNLNGISRRDYGECIKQSTEFYKN